jgi:hypothetical protein
LNFIRFGFVTCQNVFFYTDGHILGIMRPIWKKKFATDTRNPPKSPYFLPQLVPAILNFILFGFMTCQNVLWTQMDTFWPLWDQFGRKCFQLTS